MLFILEPEELLERWQGKKLSKSAAGELSGIQEIHWLGAWAEIIYPLIASSGKFFFNVSEPAKTGSPLKDWNERLKADLTSRYPDKPSESIAPWMKTLRLIKEPEELEAMREACRITKDAFLYAFRIVRPGMGEYELEAEVNASFTRHKAAHAFAPILAGGINSCTLHYTTNQSLLESGDVLLMDMGAEYFNYASDCTRTIPVNGRFSQRQLEVYKAVLDVQRRMIPCMKPGNTIELLNKEARMLLEEKLIQLGLLSLEEIEKQDPSSPAYKRFTIHGLSHFIGLDVHDPGDQQLVLEPGMVLSCEPGIYIPGEKLGIRIEDQILITDGEPEVLTAAVPVYPEELYACLDAVIKE